MSFISYLINGISLGSVYALIALGYTMVYGIAKMLNFAHGDVIMVGAFITYTMCSTMGLSPVIGVLAAVIACTLLGMAIEKVAYKPLRKASSPLAVLITAIGVSYLLQNVALLIFGANAKAFTSVVSVPALKLADGQINVNYIYSFVIREGKAPVMVFHTDDFEKAESVLKQADAFYQQDQSRTGNVSSIRG